MNRILTPRVLVPIVVVFATFVVGYLLGGNGQAPPADGSAPVVAVASRPEVWTCSMHPQIKLPKPGKCPLCFMDLIPLATDGDDEAGPTTLVMSESAAALARIRTAPVVRGAAAAEVRLVGAVAYDETRYRTITAWVSGRIDTLFVDFTGSTVAAGGRLVSLYSPDLFAAQTELLNAIEADRSVSRSNSDLLRETSAATIESARRRLNLWGLDDEQIAAVERRGYASHHITIPSPLGGVVVHKDAIEGMFVQPGTRLFTVADLRGVWVEMDAYEKDLVWLREGQDIRFSVEALPGETFEASVIFIDPVLDARKRTVRIRLAADNADGRLKPGMFVKAVVSATLSEGDDPLMIPASAPLITGKRAVVYVQLPDRDKPSLNSVPARVIATW